MCLILLDSQLEQFKLIPGSLKEAIKELKINHHNQSEAFTISYYLQWLGWKRESSEEDKIRKSVKVMKKYTQASDFSFNVVTY